MKLMTVLMLAALPLYCSAGSGCDFLKDIIHETADPQVSVEDYLLSLKGFVDSEASKEAVREFKQCFLNQSNETLHNFEVMMETIYSSPYCKDF